MDRHSGVDTDLTAIVVTRRRPALLDRAIKSLAAQRKVGLRVLVIVDDCSATMDLALRLARSGGAISTLEWRLSPRTAEDRSGPRRLAQLRHLAVDMVATRWCGFLDDDNVLEPNHFCTLIQSAISNGIPLAHSWRSLWTRDGNSYPLLGEHPWCRDRVMARKMFHQYEGAGIYEWGSNIIRDQVVPGDRDRSMVDMSEWIFDTTLLKSIGFVSDYSAADWIMSRAEDSKLLDQVVRLGVRVPSTQLATLRYHLGGYSNDWTNEAAEINGWVCGASL